MTATATTHALWHPFADMGSVDERRMLITRALLRQVKQRRGMSKTTRRLSSIGATPPA